MQLIYSSERNHLVSVIVNNAPLRTVKTINWSTKTGVYTDQYDIERTESFKIIIIERMNSRLFRLIINFFVLLFGGLAGGISPAELKSVKYTKSKLVLEGNTKSLADAIRVHQIVGNPPFQVEVQKSESNKECGECKVLFNGRFKGSAKTQIKNATRISDN